MIQDYVFTVNALCVLGTPSDMVLEGMPQIQIRPTRVVCNMDIECFSEWRMAKEDMFKKVVRTGRLFTLKQGLWPLIGPDAGVRVVARYDGVVPEGFKEGYSFTACLLFLGLAVSETKR